MRATGVGTFSPWLGGGEARQIAAQKKAAGFRTALVEPKRDNLFTLSLGNVQRQDLMGNRYFSSRH